MVWKILLIKRYFELGKKVIGALCLNSITNFLFTFFFFLPIINYRSYDIHRTFILQNISKYLNLFVVTKYYPVYWVKLGIEHDPILFIIVMCNSKCDSVNTSHVVIHVSCCDDSHDCLWSFSLKLMGGMFTLPFHQH